jgi:hypothetical protein
MSSRAIIPDDGHADVAQRLVSRVAVLSPLAPYAGAALIVLGTAAELRSYFLV